MSLRAIWRGFFDVRPGEYMRTGLGELRMRGLAPEIRQAAEYTGAEVAEVAKSTEALLAA
jgi:hypothetical protein